MVYLFNHGRASVNDRGEKNIYGVGIITKNMSAIQFRDVEMSAA